MWKDYSIGFIKKNRASSVSVMVAAFISTPVSYTHLTLPTNGTV